MSALQQGISQTSNEKLLKLLVGMESDNKLSAQAIENNCEDGVNGIEGWYRAYIALVDLTNMLRVIAPEIDAVLGYAATEKLIPFIQKEIDNRKANGTLSEDEIQKVLVEFEAFKLAQKTKQEEEKQAEDSIFDGKDPNNLFDNMN